MHEKKGGASLAETSPPLHVDDAGTLAAQIGFLDLGVLQQFLAGALQHHAAHFEDVQA